ncbi:MAG: hypothetical protein RM368_39220 [Nostoc sp. DedSLP03]|uniref:hypothetical protein n=1 Tax=Nostoc sp. DedSLP03 TaxID=3075400 RepID=UPI002AD5B0B8|nr:hypothetical protein [Nostoc sp. DedSLP03]MDZ7970887.1 hypothetical protein [Nostoc sp. DedSLP03]
MNSVTLNNSPHYQNHQTLIAQKLMIPNLKKLVIEDIYLQEIELKDTETQSINGGSPTLPLPPPSNKISLFSPDWVAIQPQPLPPRVSLTPRFYS